MVHLRGTAKQVFIFSQRFLGAKESISGQLSRPELSSEAKPAPCSQSTDALTAFHVLFLKDQENLWLFLDITLPQAQAFSPGRTNLTLREKELPESACTLVETPSRVTSKFYQDSPLEFLIPQNCKVLFILQDKFFQER